jgi:hypothetical protein
VVTPPLLKLLHQLVVMLLLLLLRPLLQLQTQLLRLKAKVLAVVAANLVLVLVLVVNLVLVVSLVEAREVHQEEAAAVTPTEVENILFRDTGSYIEYYCMNKGKCWISTSIPC